MKKQYIYSALVLTALLCAGCAKEIEDSLDSTDGAAIELSSVSTDPLTKAVITGTEFTTSEAEAGIGLFLLDGSGNAYGSNAGNVRYAHNDGKWTAASPLRVGGTAGTLYGYYPYSEGVTDITAIPVASSVNGTDYLYATPTNVSSTDAKNVSLSLSHALARVSLSFKLDASYVGDGSLSAISLSGDCVAASGTLNAKTRGISATASKFSADGLDRTVTKSASTVVECLVVPVANESGTPELRIACTIDGKAYATTFTGNLAALAQGRQTTIELTVKNTSITVDGSSIGAWGDGGTQTVTVGGDYTVTVKLAEVPGIEKDIWVMAYTEGTSVIIKAQAESGRPVECILSDDKLCDFTKNNIYTFTISGISSDLTATVGYVVAHSVSLNKDALNLIKDYGHYRLVATVLPEDAEDKTLIWSSSDKSVATVDQNGFVKALATGSATITAETKVGGYTATCSVTVAEPQSRPDGALPGHFSVSDNRVVYFSKGNLYCSGAEFNIDGKVTNFNNATWGFETHQYDTTPSVDGDRAPNHISHFMWCNSAEKAMALKYDSVWNDQSPSPFFAEKDFPVGGVDSWSTLTVDEWDYLLGIRTMNNNVPRCTNKTSGVTIGGIQYSGLFIYPDDYDGKEVGDESETWIWENINDAGIVFLPAAGCRDGSYGDARIDGAGDCGYYWSSFLTQGHYALGLGFTGSIINPGHSDGRYQARSIRLVTDVN